MARHLKSQFGQVLGAPITFGRTSSLVPGSAEESEPIISSQVQIAGESLKIESARTLREDVTIQLIIYMVGFSEGLTHLAALAIYYLLKDDLGLGPAETSALFVLPSLPWFLKPLLAFLSDTTPILGMRRKPYLIVFSLVETVGYLVLAEYPNDVASVSAGLLTIALGAAFCSAISEALVVEIAALKAVVPSNAAASASWSVSELIGAKAVGSLIVAYLSGALLELYSKRSVFRVTAMFPLMITVAACVMRDIEKPPLIPIAEQFRILKAFLRQKAIWGPALFILMFMGGPDYDDALFYFYTVVLNFTPSFMGSLRFTYGVAALVGIILYNAVLRDFSYRMVLSWTIIIALPIYISPVLLVSGRNRDLGISDEVFVLSGGFLVEAVAELQLLPLLVFTALICPLGLEGSVYSIMMSIRNLGSAFGKASSAITLKALGVTANDFSALVPLIWICGLFTVMPLFFIGLIPTQSEMTQIRAKNMSRASQHNEGGAPLIGSFETQQIWNEVSDDLKNTLQDSNTSVSSIETQGAEVI